MSTSALQQLTIQCLRGSVARFSLPFEKNKRLTVIYGENGAGKSTICDAFEFIGKGKVGSLENRGLGVTKKYWQSVGKKSADIAVSLQTSDSTCTTTVHKGDVVCHPPDLRPKVEVLRRAQILSLVEAKPADRYNAISRFIDVTGVETSEGALRQLIKDISGSRNLAVARIQENIDTIQSLWEAAGQPGDDSIVWAGAESTAAPQAGDTELARLSTLQTAYQRLQEFHSRYAQANKAALTAQTAAENAAQALAECIQTSAPAAAELMAILKAAELFLLKQPTPEACPLCDSPEKIQGLSNRVAKRLEAFNALQATQARQAAVDNELRVASQQLNNLTHLLTDLAGKFQVAAAGAWPADIKVPA